MPVFVGGSQVYQSPTVMEIQAYAKADMATMWDEYRRLMQPHIYKVDLSDSLWMLKNSMIQQLRRG